MNHISTLLIESKIHVLAGDLRGLDSDSIKNDLALGELKLKVPSERDICCNAASAQAKKWDRRGAGPSDALWSEGHSGMRPNVARSVEDAPGAGGLRIQGLSFRTGPRGNNE